MSAGERKPAGHGSKRDRREDEAIAALLMSPSLKAAAEQARIGVATLRRWLADPSFAARYRDERRAALERATAALQGGASDAAVVLRLIARDKDAADSARVTACRAILEFALRASELEDIGVRLAELEGRMPAPKGGPKTWGR